MQFKGRVIGKDVSRISQNICTQASFLEVNYLNPAVAVTTPVSFVYFLGNFREQSSSLNSDHLR